MKVATLRRYGIAVIFCSVALAVAWPLDAPSSCFFLAVMATSLLEGKGPSLLSVGLSALAFDYFFLPPRFHLFVQPASYLRFAAFLGATLLVDMAHIAGLVAVGLHPTPVPLSDFVTSTTHKTLRGPRGGIILCKEQWAPAIDKSVFPGIQGGPLMHTIAAKAVAFREALQPSFKTYQESVIANAKAMAEEFSRAGLRLVGGGTDTHLMLVDVSVKGLTGKAVETYLDEIGITVNKNAIPFDQQKPMVTSGIRIGTPAITSRGLGLEECREVSRIIVDALPDIEHRANVEKLRSRVHELTSRFDVP